MKIAVFGHWLFYLALGLRNNPNNHVELFLDSNTVPTCLLGEPELSNSKFVRSEPWIKHQELLRPRSAKLTKELSEFDIAIVTDLGPIFAHYSGIEFVFIPAGSDLTTWPFPFRARKARSRGRPDIAAAVVAFQMRRGIRSASGIWGAPFRPLTLAADRLQRSVNDGYPQAMNTEVFAPNDGESVERKRTEKINIFHPTRMMFTPDPFLIEIGGWKRNDLLLKGFAMAVGQGVDATLTLIDRLGSPDTDRAKALVGKLGVADRVQWLRSKTDSGFTWREMADLYRSSDVVADGFGGWLELVALEGASSGKPVMNFLPEDVMESTYPGGHPFLQASNEAEICDLISALTDPDYRSSVGRESREWILAHHDNLVVARNCEKKLKAILSKRMT